MTQEYGRWPESTWKSADIDWKKANTITAGVDIGAVSSQAVVICDGELYCYSNLYTVAGGKASAERAIAQALQGTGMAIKDIQFVAATGFGKKNVPFAQKTVNEILCHAKGARFMYGPTVRTVVDMGGETTKAIKLYEWDRVVDFAVNDKCATGMGEGIEVMADLLHIPIQEMGERSLSVKEDPEPVSTTCRIFAGTEALGLLRSSPENEVLAAYLFAVAYRIYGLVGRIGTDMDLSKPVHLEKDLALTGGVAKNTGVVKRLERELGMTALTPKYDVQLAGAIGAALFARAALEKAPQAVAGAR
ncbi:MAG: benzoyl-CoA reductase, bzd-type, subunit Q [Chloroflexi bacterium]|nr:benzoyl-CoA reductase, bzd-type, subunit Q [Chloroflexota bacterium]